MRPSIRSILAVLVLAGVVTALGACEAGAVPATPPISPGTADAPRDVNLIARDYSYVPDTLDLVPGERVVLHVINAGLVTHEAILGDDRVQDAWEAAEAAVAGAPPGPTPVVRVPDDVAGVRIVVESGQRVDLEWTVPAGPEAGPGFVVGCHIAGHWERGMQIPVRWVQPDRNAASHETRVEAATP